MTREMWEGNQAIAEAAVRAGLEAYFGYPITPQTEALEYLSRRMPELGRTFVQAESELGAINMVYGAACAGVRVMSTSSSPGVSLMMEGLSYIAGTEVPAVLVNVMRGGPGLGNIAPAQADYNQAAHGGGHGDYQQYRSGAGFRTGSRRSYGTLIRSCREISDNLHGDHGWLNRSDDGAHHAAGNETCASARIGIGPPTAAWAIGQRRILTSIYLDPLEEEVTNLRLLERWKHIQADEVRYKEYFLDDAEFVIIGFGTAGRVALSAVRAAREQGIKVGLLRPITVSPFPVAAIEQLIPTTSAFLVVEMNSGQMLDDVRLAVKGRIPVEFYGRLGGVVPFPDEILNEIHRIVKNKPSLDVHPREAWFERMMAAI